MFLPGMSSEEIFKMVLSDKQEVQKAEFKIFKEACKKALRGKSTFPYHCYDLLTTKNSNQYLMGIEINNSNVAIEGRTVKHVKDCKRLAITKMHCLFRYNDGHYGVYCPNVLLPELFKEITNHFLVRYAERTNLIYNNEIDIIKAFSSNNNFFVVSNEYSTEELYNAEPGKIHYWSCHEGLIPVLTDEKRKMDIYLTFIDSDSLTNVKKKHDFDYNDRIDELIAIGNKDISEMAKLDRRA